MSTPAKIFAAVIAVLILIVLALAYFGASLPASAHSWYDYQCCSDRDCEPIPPDDMRMIYQKANYFWHSDSSFKRIPSLCSVLTARICPAEGGNTEFLSMRAAWNALPPALQATIHPLVAEHALQHSRDRVQKGILSAKAIAELPPVKQRLFQDNPINGRRALYIGAHAGHIGAKCSVHRLVPAGREVAIQM